MLCQLKNITKTTFLFFSKYDCQLNIKCDKDYREIAYICTKKLKKMRNKAALFLLLFAFIACKQESANQKQEDHSGHEGHHVGTTDNLQPPMFNEIMAVHDEIMPWMNNIEKLKGDVRLKIDSIDAGADSQYRGQFRNAMVELNRADDMMTDWMNNFKNNYDSITDDSSRNIFLLDERNKIEVVKMKMDESIKIAKQVLANTPLR